MKKQSENAHLEQIRSLPVWKASVDIAPLSGGISNRNYVVNDRGKRYVVRMLGEQPLLGINRQNEVLCMKAAYQCGVAPRLIHSEPGIMVTEFIDGQVLKPEDVRKKESIERIAGVLRVVHGTGPYLTGEMIYFSHFQYARTYAQRAREIGARMPSDIDEALEDSLRLESMVCPFLPTLCHNDVLAANWIWDGTKMWLVDWEYAGISNPISDLANLSANSRFTKEMDEELLRCYRGGVTEEAMRDIKIIKVASCLREALWGVVQTVNSDLDFDYHQYVADNLGVYHAARQELGKV